MSGAANQLVVGSYPAAITAQAPPATGTITTADAMATEGAQRVADWHELGQLLHLSLHAGQVGGCSRCRPGACTSIVV